MRRHPPRCALDGGAESKMEIAGKAPDSAWRTMFQQVTEEYFGALRIEVNEGRPFTAADVNDARKVAVVNETFVRMYLPNDHPIGQRVRLTNLEKSADPVRDAWFEIVGVVGDVRNRGLRAPTEPEVWIPSTVPGALLQFLIVRTSQDPSTLTNAVRHEVSATDSGVPLINPVRLEDLPQPGFLCSATVRVSVDDRVRMCRTDSRSGGRVRCAGLLDDAEDA